MILHWCGAWSNICTVSQPSNWDLTCAPEYPHPPAPPPPSLLRSAPPPLPLGTPRPRPGPWLMGPARPPPLLRWLRVARRSEADAFPSCVHRPTTHQSGPLVTCFHAPMHPGIEVCWNCVIIPPPLFNPFAVINEEIEPSACTTEEASELCGQVPILAVRPFLSFVLVCSWRSPGSLPECHSIARTQTTNVVVTLKCGANCLHTIHCDAAFAIFSLIGCYLSANAK